MAQNETRKLLVKELVRYYSGLNQTEKRKLENMYMKKDPELWKMIQARVDEDTDSL